MENNETATLGGGCFWCVEAVYQRLEGVTSVTSGYSGGHVDNPEYRQVCAGETGHAEVVQVEFDPDVISYETLLEVFFTVHDPTQLNRQGPDVGPQYRSVIFYHDDEQKRIAKSVLERMNAPDRYDGAVVTELEAFEEFYPAEPLHQNYYRNNPQQAYCRQLIPPKLQKLHEKHGGIVASEDRN